MAARPQDYAPEWVPAGAGTADGFATRVMAAAAPGDTPAPAAGPLRRRPPPPAELWDGLRRGERAALARAITLVESRAPAHRAAAAELLGLAGATAPERPEALRVGITGMPGAGKSTFLEALGQRLCAAGERVAVLAVDPSSPRSGGSILGDKTRMEQLARNPRAFIRPSPSGGTLGGVARRTREAMFLVEAAGYSVVLVETVGVGQSEVTVRGMVDCFVLLQLPGAGDELQGIKKGIVELADLVVITKADGDNLARAQAARAIFTRALRYAQPASPPWNPRVLACSALTGEGLDEVWAAVQRFRETTATAGAWTARRREQALAWFEGLVDEGLRERFLRAPAVKAALAELRPAVAAGTLPATLAAERLLGAAGA